MVQHNCGLVYDSSFREGILKLYRKHFQFNVRVTLLTQPKHVLIKLTNMVSQTSLWFIFVFVFKGGGIEGARGGRKFLKLSL